MNETEKALEWLEEIKKAPSFMGGNPKYLYHTKSEIPFMEDIETIKQALTQAQELEVINKNMLGTNRELAKEIVELKETKSKKELAFDVIKEKQISVWGFRNAVFGYQRKYNGNKPNDTYEYYKHNYGKYHSGFDFENDLLTQEEFELLKEVLGWPMMTTKISY